MRLATGKGRDSLWGSEPPMVRHGDSLPTLRYSCDNGLYGSKHTDSTYRITTSPQTRQETAATNRDGDGGQEKENGLEVRMSPS